MTYINLINNISYFLISIITAGVVFRLVYCFIMLQSADEEAQKYKKRILNALIFLIIAMSAFSIKELLFSYYNNV